MTKEGREERQILIQREAAAFVGVSRHRLVRLEQAGHFRRLRCPGKAVNYRRCDLEAFLSGGTNNRSVSGAVAGRIKPTTWRSADDREQDEPQ